MRRPSPAFPAVVVAAALIVLGADVARGADPAPSALPVADAAPPPNPEKPLPPKAPKKTPELLELGKKVYDAHCLTCHGEKGDGNGPVGQVLVPRPRDFAKDPFKQGTRPEDVFLTVTHGVKDTAMVGYPQLTDEERWAVSFHVLELVPKKAKDGKAKDGKAKATPPAGTPKP